MKEGIGASGLHGSDIATLLDYPHGSVMDDGRALGQISRRSTGSLLDKDTPDETRLRSAGCTPYESKRNEAREA